MRQFFFLLIIIIVASGSVSICLADEQQGMGPEEIILQSTIDPVDPNKPRRAFYPHAKHQERYYCSTCHHTADNEGKQALYNDDMKIEKCETCHNKSAIYKGMPKRLATFKEVAHLRCKGCHRKLKKEGKATGPITCRGCHRPEINQ